MAARTLGRLVLSWLAVTAAAFVLLRLMPGDPIAIFLDQLSVQASPETVAAYRTQWGLDGSLLGQFLRWLLGFLTLDWGVSFETGRAVSEDFAARLPYSAAIGFGGMALAVLGGYGLGFLAALRPHGWADVGSRALVVAGQALPAFAVGLVLLWVLGVQLRWINVFGGGPVERVVLPMLLVAVFSIGSMARITRAGFMDVKASPYFRTALAKGRSTTGALWHHGRASGALALIAALAPELAWIVGGTAVAEIVFAVPGVSERVVQAVNNRDYAILQPYIALVALWVAVVLQAGRALRHALDPRLA
ncbi:ABC transporter permease [Tateyamaria sp. ANG-S1]|uniref:ABC transporter permease n=1 Tax=Tateyamaria sp. ANG-S1 TaxID=1577905 RepID=UPI00187C4A68|nr:ABC transporter permease [Tateyamaria sp. ANG-S1]